MVNGGCRAAVETIVVVVACSATNDACAVAGDGSATMQTIAASGG